MSASHAPAFDAAALQLVAALEKYERDVDAMVAGWLDMQAYRLVSDEVEDIRALSAGLPFARVPWVELLIAHAELVHSLWRLRFRDDPADGERLRAVRERHAACVEALRGSCLRSLANGEGACATMQASPAKEPPA